MPITPDLPFPKSPGDPIRSKDWNDLVVETQRLDTAKVDRAGDAITGPLSVAGALAVGMGAAAPTARLDVGGDLRVHNNNLLLRGGTDANHGLGWFGTGKLFAGANVDGPVLWGNNGGGLGSGTGAGQQLALRWDNAQRVTIGVPSTELRVDISGRIRLRNGLGGTAGLWLHHSGPNNDRAFVGMMNDNVVGFWGNEYANWGLMMNTALGTAGVRITPSSSVALYVNRNAVGASPALTYGLLVTGGSGGYALYGVGDSYVTGRLRDSRIRTQAASASPASTTSTSWVNLPSLGFSLTAPEGGASFLLMVQVNGVQITGTGNARGSFRLLVDGNEVERTRVEFHNNGWELRCVSMMRIHGLTAGSHTLQVQWETTAGTLTCCWYNDQRRLMAIEL